MKLNDREKNAIEMIRNISGDKAENIYNMFRAIQALALLEFAQGEDTVIPCFGKFKLNYLGDTITSKGKQANIEAYFIPSDELKKNIGQIEDYKKGEIDDISKIPAIKEFLIANKSILKMHLNNIPLDAIEED
jgi:hypothetical protein